LKKIKVLLSLMIVALLAVGFITGCGGGDDDGGGTDTGTVYGTVTDNNNNPVQGATCTLNAVTTGAKATSGTTDVNGDFEITAVPVGTYTLTVSMTGYTSVTTSSFSVTSGSSVSVPTNETVITPTTTTGTVTGTVTDATSGSAISGVTVTLSGTSFTGTTDANGLYTISSVTPASYTVTASKTGYNSYTSSSQITVTGGATTTHNFTMTVAYETGKGHVTGTVTDDNGSAVSGATVQIVEKGKATISDTTDSNGNYMLANVNAGSQTLTTSMTGYTTQNVSVTVVEGSTITQNVTLSQEIVEGDIIWVSEPSLIEDQLRTSQNPTVSDDANIVAFISDQPNLNDQGNVPGQMEAFMYNRTTATLTRISKAYDGTTADAASANPFVAGGGAYIVFNTAATDIVDMADNGGAQDVYRYDVSAGTNTLVSKFADGTRPNGVANDTTAPACSDDGRYIVMLSEADLAQLATANGMIGGNGTPDVWLRDMSQATVDVTLVSTDRTDNTMGAGDTVGGGAGSASVACANPVISDDGKFVAYNTAAINVAQIAGANPANGLEAVYRWNRLETVVNKNYYASADKNTAEPAALALATGSVNPCINMSGSHVGYESDLVIGYALVPSAAGSLVWNVFVNNLNDGQKTNYIAFDYSTNRADANNLTIDDAGTYVAFNTATKVGSSDQNNANDVYVGQLGTSNYYLVSRTYDSGSQGISGNDRSQNGMISGNGEYVAFQSEATNLVNSSKFQVNVWDIFLKRWAP